MEIQAGKKIRNRINTSAAEAKVTEDGEAYAKPVTIEDVKQNEEVLAYINQANDSLGVLGYTEHGLRHADLTAHIAQNILRRLGMTEREAELAAIAAFLHDIGNLISREAHGVSSALLSRDLLRELGMPPVELAAVMTAVGGHEEESGMAVNRISAAVILA